MSESQTVETRVFVTGDYIADCHIYEGRRQHFGQPVADGVTVVEELGARP